MKAFTQLLRSGRSILVLSFALIACSKDEVTKVKSLTRYDVGYMFYPSGYVFMPDPIVNIDYSGNRISRRTGGFVPKPGLSGTLHSFSVDVYDDVTYEDDKIIIVTKDNLPDIDVSPYRKELTMQSGKITRTITTASIDPSLIGLSLTFQDTTDFVYKNNVLWKTVRKTYVKGSGDFEFYSNDEKIFTFSGGNLTKVERVLSAPFDVRTETLELFEDYDQAPNPAQDLVIFDETFYRSLSKNNFRKYSLYQRRNTAAWMNTNQNVWTFNYDDQGVPTFLR